MKLHINSNEYIDTSFPLDISIPLSNTAQNPKAWYVEAPVFEPVRTEHYTGSVEEGGSVNFRNIFFNPHGHGTHTECLGHITEKVHSINTTLKEYMFRARLVTIEPKKIKNAEGTFDDVITKDQLVELGNISDVEALIIRTHPNRAAKRSMNYSNTNPAYFEVECARHLIESGIQHLLVDLPSVDRESDGGLLAFHHAFWEVPENPSFERTITELIFVDDELLDGVYLLNLQVAPFENDAAPSRPVLYKIKKV